MRKLIAVVVFSSLVAVSGAFAAPADTGEGDSQSYTAFVPSMAAITEWVAGYFDSYSENGIYQAVAEVIEAGEVSLDDLTETSLTAKEMEGLNPQNLVAAYYCAGVSHEDIRATCELFNISEIIIVAAFETAQTVCGDEILDTQAYTKMLQFSGPPAGITTTNAFASGDGFTSLQ